VIPNALPVRRLVPIGLVALVAGAAVAQAADGGAATPRAAAAATPAAAAPAWVAPAPVAPLPAVAPYGRAARVVPLPCGPASRKRAAARTPPSDALKNAFAILRRERTDEDALPGRALRALKAQGLDPVDAQSARLLRADGAARAWVVPVPDVGEATALGCLRGAAARKPREGIAVVSLGGAPAGGGGALRDLQRGHAPAALDPCAGAGHNMLGVSGMVPDGVDAVFVTAADGTSTRADVRDNGYAFVLPRPRRAEQRYIVWTGSDGSPRVQPLPLALLGGRITCARVAATARVTPDPWSAACLPYGAGPVDVVPRRAWSRRSSSAARRPAPAAQAPSASGAAAKHLRLPVAVVGAAAACGASHPAAAADVRAAAARAGPAAGTGAAGCAARARARASRRAPGAGAGAGASRGPAAAASRCPARAVSTRLRRPRPRRPAAWPRARADRGAPRARAAPRAGACGRWRD